MTPNADSEAYSLARVTLDVCQACLLGKGGECHTPGCAFWMSQAPDVPLGIVIEASPDDGSGAQ